MIRFNQFTFTNIRLKKEHISLRFCNDGTIRHLSRAKARSVKPIWNAIGRFWKDANGTMFAAFFANVPHLWVAATHMARTMTVTGAQVRPFAATMRERTANVTDPESGMTRKSVDLGQDYTSEAGASQFRVNGRHSVDVAAMRAAILARK